MPPPEARVVFMSSHKEIFILSERSGLVNQLYGHMAALLLVYGMGAELILHPALSRDSFGSNTHEVKWQGLPLNSILDVAHLTTFWSKRGVILHQVQVLLVNFSLQIYGNPEYE